MATIPKRVEDRLAAGVKISATLGARLRGVDNTVQQPKVPRGKSSTAKLVAIHQARAAAIRHAQNGAPGGRALPKAPLPLIRGTGPTGHAEICSRSAPAHLVGTLSRIALAISTEESITCGVEGLVVPGRAGASVTRVLPCPSGVRSIVKAIS